MGSLTPSHHKLPTIDFTNQLENTTPDSTDSSWLMKCKDVRSALEDYGCFIGVFDKVSAELDTAVFGALIELFDLPTETKMQNKSTKPLYGYVGQIPFIPLYESLGIDFSNTPQGIQSFTDVMWPEGNEDFSEILLSYTKLVAEMEQMVVRMIFESYGVGKYYDNHAKAATYLCRAMEYKTPGKNQSNMGFVSHTDKDFVTILHQNQVNGLEIKAKDGEWFSVELTPSSFIVMAGEAAMAWSNNRMYSPYHRVTMNYGKEARYSIAQFSFMEGMIETPEELVDEEHPLQYKPFDHLKFLAFYDKEENRKLECAIKSYCGVSD
ncbi:putative 2-oxoglutarate-dependent dioxygenase AOP1 [Heracleum sosnowskyi]|uniref:2-oxoglutarate-dependent dioxygenase AOP1 n=1 Tax=Heracleum sosnowskyi TaxID=360622 RepID=A0AAD8MHC4_9APIA|nr:putative 2-oxoglutarate-dependent dioxygenase AOP1 [Heracleum sosnowskyi]